MGVPVVWQHAGLQEGLRCLAAAPARLSVTGRMRGNTVKWLQVVILHVPAHAAAGAHGRPEMCVAGRGVRCLGSCSQIHWPMPWPLAAQEDPELGGAGGRPSCVRWQRAIVQQWLATK